MPMDNENRKLTVIEDFATWFIRHFQNNNTAVLAQAIENYLTPFDSDRQRIIIMCNAINNYFNDPATLNKHGNNVHMYCVTDAEDPVIYNFQVSYTCNFHHSTQGFTCDGFQPEAMALSFVQIIDNLVIAYNQYDNNNIIQ